MATEKKHALYLRNPDTESIELIHADDVEARKAEGWKEPEGQKANGQGWNLEEELPGQDAAAESAKRNAEAKAKKAAEQEKERAAAEKAAVKAAEDAEKADKAKK